MAPATAGDDDPLPAGFSLSIDTKVHHSSPTIADVDGDGVNDIVVAGLDGLVRVLHGDGSPVAGWPQPVVVPGADGPTAVESTPAVADLDGDGDAEVIVGAGSLEVQDQHGGLVVFEHDGTPRCGFRTADTYDVWNVGTGQGPDGYSEGVFSSPAVGDVDGDRRPDVIFGAWDWKIHGIDRRCRPLPGFPFHHDDTVWSSPALYDVDRDGRLEIFIGGDASPGGMENWRGGVFRALDWANGAVRELWKRRIAEIVQSSPAIGDIDRDGRLEAVVGAGVFYQNDDSNRVYAWHLDDGSDVPGWPQDTGDDTLSSPALGDLNGDARLDVVIGSRDGRVHAWTGSGRLLWRVFPWSGRDTGEIVASPVVTDVNGNGRPDVVIGNGALTYFLDGRTGKPLWAPVGDGFAYQNAPAIGDFGPLGWQVVYAGFRPDEQRGVVASVRIPNPGVRPVWPMFRRIASHIAAPLSGGNPLAPNQCTPPSNPPAEPSDRSAAGYWFVSAAGSVFSFYSPFHGSLQTAGVRARARSIDARPQGDGYWILGADGGVFAFGGAGFHGSMAGQPLNGPVVALEPTTSGEGYWLFAADGGVFAFGDARALGSLAGRQLRAPIIAAATTPTGRGYWLLGQDGGIFAFGDARFHGSTGGLQLAAPVISMAASPTGGGYWLLAADGGVFSFGVPFHGSVPGTGLCTYPRSIQIRTSTTGAGYWVLGDDGGVFSFGDAKFQGSYPGLRGAGTAIDMAVRRS
jgi:hypothetical protein